MGNIFQFKKITYRVGFKYAYFPLHQRRGCADVTSTLFFVCSVAVPNDLSQTAGIVTDASAV